MKQRGRKSLVSQDVAGLKVIDGGFGGVRPDAPPQLTPRQAEIWNLTVRDEPAEFFATYITQELLVALCQHVESREIIADTINQFEPGWLKSKEGARRYQELCKSRATETYWIGFCATKLRITNQSRYSEKTAYTASQNTLKGGKTWEWDPPFK